MAVDRPRGQPDTTPTVAGAAPTMAADTGGPRYGPHLDVPRRTAERTGALGGDFSPGLLDGYRLDKPQYDVARALASAGYSVQALRPEDHAGGGAHAIIRGDANDPGLYAELRMADSPISMRNAEYQIRDASANLREAGHVSYAVAVYGGPGYDRREADRQHQIAMGVMHAQGEHPPSVTYHVHGAGEVLKREYDASATPPRDLFRRVPLEPEAAPPPIEAAGSVRRIGALGERFEPGVYDTPGRLDPDQTRIAEALALDGISVHTVYPGDPPAGNAHAILRESPDDPGRYAQLRGTALPPSMRTPELEIRRGASEMLGHRDGVVIVDGGPGFRMNHAREQSRITLTVMDAQGERPPATIGYLLDNGTVRLVDTDLMSASRPGRVFDQVRLPSEGGRR